MIESRARAPVRVLIYGSCVSRDTFEVLDVGRYSLVGYIARQSIISAFGAPHTNSMDKLDDLPPFQARMIRGDLDSNLTERLLKDGPGADVLLWDLFDERLGVYRLADGSYVTRTPELIKVGMATDLERSAEYIPMGSDEHFALWTRGAVRLAALVSSPEIDLTPIVVDAPWALRADDESEVPASFGMSSQRANALLRRYYAFIREELGIATASLTESQTIASATHRWGSAPFHYTFDTYARIGNSIGIELGDIHDEHESAH